MAFLNNVEEVYRKPFTELEQEEKVTYIKDLNATTINGTKENPKESFFMTIKEPTAGGFCTSKARATQVLKYGKVPGEYRGCVPYEEIGKTWAT